MNMRQGIVVDTHPDDNAVDLFMVDNGERLVGVKVLTMGASSRTGGIDLPEITGRADKWDISEDSDNLVWAAVGYLSRQPVVTGFILPPANQVATRDKRTLYRRHQSDVQWSIDGDGNAQLLHPSGAYIRMGEAPDAAPVASAQGATVDRNTGRKPNVRIGLADNAVTVTFTPDGHMLVKLEGNVELEAEGNALIKAASATIDAPNTRCTGNLRVDGGVSVGEDVVTDIGVSHNKHPHTGNLGAPTSAPHPTG